MNDKKVYQTQYEEINYLLNSRTGAYKEGFYTDLKSDTIEKGLNADVVKAISAKKNEPQWMLDFRLKAYEKWAEMEEPKWAKLDYEPIDYQNYSYYSAPSSSCETHDKSKPQEIDQELLDTFSKLGVPVQDVSADSIETSNSYSADTIAVDAIFDSVSVATTQRDVLKKSGVIFCSFSEAIAEYPDLVQKYLATVVPIDDNYFACLNSAVASDGTFVYIPKGVKCPMELSTYFRINHASTGQFERTILIADEGSEVSYIEGCSAPARSEYQLHAAVVEVIVHKNATVKYSTVQNWYPGDKNNKGGILNFVTKRGICAGDNSKLSWTQVETGSAITWKYPSCILMGDNSIGEFYSVALTNNNQQADTGTKMIHLGKNTKSTIISKGLSAGFSNNTYRGLVKVGKNATNARNFTQCDSMLIDDKCGAHTFPYVQVNNPTAHLEHEATTSKIGDDQLFYLAQRGIGEEDAISMLVNGFCKKVFKELPLEFAKEAEELLKISLEGSVG